METINTIKISLFVLNACALLFVLIFIRQWHIRMEEKLDYICEYIKRTAYMNGAIYINQLEALKKKLIEAERYEEAAKIRKYIETEYENLGIKQ